MIIKLRKPDSVQLVQVGFFDRNAKLVYKSIMEMHNLANRAKNNIITLILLLTIFILFFFATSVKVFMALLISGLIIEIFVLIKDYRERRNENEKS